jgi:FKBP-type peptidyl-prolyl cis-trans isomerase FkpA
MTATRFLRMLPFLALLALASACSDSPTAPAPVFSQTDLRAGSGTAAASGSTLSVTYTGWLYDESRPDQKGLQFDSNVGGTPFTFTLGAAQVIQGWDQGLVGIQTGGIRRLVVPPGLAYGSIRNGPIPPNSTLIFDVEVTAVEVPQAAAVIQGAGDRDVSALSPSLKEHKVNSVETDAPCLAALAGYGRRGRFPAST